MGSAQPLVAQVNTAPHGNGNGPVLRDVRWFFFDLDGTLADSVTGLHGSIQVAFEAVGRTLPATDLRQWICPGIRTILRNLEGSLTESEIDSMERAFRADYDHQGVLRTQLFASAPLLLKTLRQRGDHLFVVTNKPKLATGKLLEAHSILGLFEDVVSRDSRSPAYGSKGEMLQETVRRHNADVAASVMVGDTEEDAEAAMHAGMRFVHAAYGYGRCVDSSHARLTDAAELLGLCGFEPALDVKSSQENE